MACASDPAAATLEVRIESAGEPVAGAVVSLHSAAVAMQVDIAASEMDQRDFQFVPRVLVIGAGSTVDFPNRDEILHHVYSFSPAKTFELPLYSGRPASPLVFDIPGVVVLGCNIHDTMVGYILVLDTPHHARSGDNGHARIDAPPGDYVLQVWHEGQVRPGQVDRRPISLSGQGTTQTVALPSAGPATPPATPPADDDDRLRLIQQRFRALRTAPVDEGDGP